MARYLVIVEVTPVFEDDEVSDAVVLEEMETALQDAENQSGTSLLWTVESVERQD